MLHHAPCTKHHHVNMKSGFVCAFLHIEYVHIRSRGEKKKQQRNNKNQPKEYGRDQKNDHYQLQQRAQYAIHFMRTRMTQSWNGSVNFMCSYDVCCGIRSLSQRVYVQRSLFFYYINGIAKHFPNRISLKPWRWKEESDTQKKSHGIQIK